MDNGRLTELLAFKSNYKLHFLDQTSGLRNYCHTRSITISKEASAAERPSKVARDRPVDSLWVFPVWSRTSCWITSSPLLIHCKEVDLFDLSWIFEWGTLQLSPLIYSSRLTMFRCDLGESLFLLSLTLLWQDYASNQAHYKEATGMTDLQATCSEDLSWTTGCLVFV